VKYDKICLMLPTYGRSHNYLPTFIQTAIATVSDPKRIHFAFLVNVNDTDTKSFLTDFDFKGSEMEMVEESLLVPHLAKYFNMLYAMTKTRDEAGTVVTMVGDDMQFKTQNWDTRMLDLINTYDGIGIFWANDEYIAREKLCVNIFTTRKFVQATERPFMCELFPGEMIDLVWYEVGRLTKTLHFDPYTIIYHNHSGKKPDLTCKRLQPSRDEGWRIGKAKARQVAEEIAAILIRKGMTGTSIC